MFGPQIRRAIHVENCPREAAGRVEGTEGHHLRDLLRSGYAPERLVGQHRRVVY